MKRVPIIDFIRFASIFIVIGGHFFPRWLVHFIGFPALQKVVLNIFLNGAYGVSCFFVVSGFLITRMMAENTADFSTIDLRPFYVKRAARIFPLLLVVVLAAYGLEQLKFLLDSRVQQYHVWNNDSGFGWLFWISLFSFNFNWYLIAHYSAVGFQWSVLWSLAVEEQFYFFYPITVKLFRTRKRILTFLSCIILFALVFRWIASFYFLENGHWMQLASFAAFDQIAIGGILYFFNEKAGDWLGARMKMSFGLLLLGTASCFYLCLSTSMLNGQELIVVPTLMAVGCALVILGGLHVPIFNSKVAHILSWPGKLSYGCYLWHPTVMFLLMPVLVSLGGLWGLIYLVLAVSFFAFLSYRYFEVPVNRRIRAWFKLKPSLSV